MALSQGCRHLEILRDKRLKYSLNKGVHHGVFFKNLVIPNTHARVKTLVKTQPEIDPQQKTEKSIRPAIKKKK